MTVDTAKLKVSTKALVAGVFGLGSLLEIPVVHDFALKSAANHPHWLAAIATAFGIAGLLHNPEVQEVLGRKITTETKTKTEDVVLDPAVKS